MLSPLTSRLSFILFELVICLCNDNSYQRKKERKEAIRLVIYKLIDTFNCFQSSLLFPTLRTNKSFFLFFWSDSAESSWPEWTLDFSSSKVCVTHAYIYKYKFIRWHMLATWDVRCAHAQSNIFMHVCIFLFGGFIKNLQEIERKGICCFLKVSREMKALSIVDEERERGQYKTLLS